ncbi:hypothetical protein YW3DRAFT_02784 [Streptomyces sp. MnatMP-M77]|nr:hypothetical protein SACT1_5602 [Streptomyces sp. ACT-1]SBV06779.1 hypothetical protein YW3DRAFT_02784 [Streptomyces sp. MnatMP-M77]SCD83580.1 hypothetical protein GA0115261_1020214 [Streptomyces sp. OspMP-M43]SEE57366.1 hypothetical protein SAMN04490359_4186 [Streptomyces griseus]SQA24866.1 Uncharacterised protein [Streptomyces griseus]
MTARPADGPPAATAPVPPIRPARPDTVGELPDA